MANHVFNDFNENFYQELKTFRGLLEQTDHDPNQENVHHLRVASRRLHAMLWLLRNDSKFAKIRSSDAMLKDLIRALGELRELDVAAADSRFYHLPSRRIHIEREAKAREIAEHLNMQSRKQLIGRLTAASLPHDQKSEKKCRRRIDQLVSKVRKLTKGKVHRRDLHPLRIELKKVLYVIEAFGKSSEPLKLLQKQIGKAHDLQKLEKLVGQNKRTRQDLRRLQTAAKEQIRPALKSALAELKSIDH